MTQLVDPDVSRAKFDREVRALRKRDTSYARRGWLLLKADFPIVEIAFLAMNAQPALIVATVRFDFTDFDLRPLSVRFVDHRSGEPLTREDLKFWMSRPVGGMPPEALAAFAAQGLRIEVQDMIQGYPGQPAFLCLPGVREYHEHASHSGDAWELHRPSGEGLMIQIAEKIWQYGVAPVTQIGIDMTVSPRPAVALA